MNKAVAQVDTGAKIEFTKETHDYGTVKYGADGTCTFEFKNTGTEPNKQATDTATAKKPMTCGDACSVCSGCRCARRHTSGEH
jgi:hypothetical protein